MVHRETLSDSGSALAQIVLHGGAPGGSDVQLRTSDDKTIETRTWLAVKHALTDTKPLEVELFFGSALATRNGKPPSVVGAALLQGLLPVHLWYSEFLFQGALQALHDDGEATGPTQ